MKLTGDEKEIIYEIIRIVKNETSECAKQVLSLCRCLLGCQTFEKIINEKTIY